jgi:CRP-like cAMP-binding protein
MFIQEADLFKGLNQETMNEISKIMVQQSYAPGELLFAEGDPANYFYVLIEGRVRLSIGRLGEIDYTVSNSGEAFGWSSLVGREVYTAQAECVTPCELIKIERDSLDKVFQRQPASGMLFFKGLAGAIGQRLIHTYNVFLSQRSPQLDSSYGTGQVTASIEE